MKLLRALWNRMLENRCKSDECRCGRDPCPTPLTCYASDLGGGNYHSPLPSAEEASGWLYIAAVWLAVAVFAGFLAYALSTLDLPDLAFLIR